MSDLLDQMDAAAIALLKRVEAKASVATSGEGDNGPESASISEAVRVFQAVAEYAKWRHPPKVAPPEPPKPTSKIAGLKDQLNGRGAHSRRRGGRGASESEAEAGDGIDA